MKMSKTEIEVLETLKSKTVCTTPEKRRIANAIRLLLTKGLVKVIDSGVDSWWERHGQSKSAYSEKRSFRWIRVELVYCGDQPGIREFSDES